MSGTLSAVITQCSKVVGSYSRDGRGYGDGDQGRLSDGVTFEPRFIKGLSHMKISGECSRQNGPGRTCSKFKRPEA